MGQEVSIYQDEIGPAARNNSTPIVKTEAARRIDGDGSKRVVFIHSVPNGVGSIHRQILSS